jgi:hypothetical protein
VVDLAVEQLNANGHAVILGDALHAVECRHRVRDCLGVGSATPVAEERDYVRHASLCRERNVGRETGDDGVVIGRIVQAVFDRAASA